MDKSAILEVVHAERATLADDLAPLTDEQWATSSLCAQWTVRDTVAHMSATAQLTGATFFTGLLASGFNFEKVQQRGIAQNRGTTPADTLSRFRTVITSNRRPPGPVQTILGETIVHSEDVRRPLSVSHTYPADAVVECAAFFATSNLIIGSKKRIAGLSLRATDANWSTGSGPEVAGPALALLLAMTGRGSALAECDGPGLDTLRTRS